MEIKMHHTGTIAVAEIVSAGILIEQAQDALELMMNCAYQGAGAVVLKQHQLTPLFFELKTGLAGDILQKFSNYRLRLAIAGDFGTYTSKSLSAFIYESNKTGRIIFCDTVENGIRLLSGQGSN